MTTYDFSPLYRSAIGFDRLVNLLENAMSGEAQPGYPPYNIELVDDNRYQITMAVAGFGEAELNLEVEAGTLTVSGNKAKEEGKHRYLHHGIAARSFQRRFQLADHVEVRGARLENGLLHIDLERKIPEALKPRRIEIQAEGGSRLIEEPTAEKAA
ncbi:MAG TPA: Hsp20 family protein [Gammaproteobacteria bacterium]